MCVCFPSLQDGVFVFVCEWGGGKVTPPPQQLITTTYQQEHPFSCTNQQNQKITFNYKFSNCFSVRNISYTKIGFYTYLKKVKKIKGVLHTWALFLKTLCIFSKNKATLDKVSHGSGQKCFKELKNHSFTLVKVIVVKLQWNMCENQYFPCFEP